MKSYGQFCGVARALDLIGDRWSMLVMRELMLRPCRYSDLRAALPGVATNLLAARLRELQDAGLVAHEDGRYAATDRGAALRPVLVELARWAMPEMIKGQGGDAARGQWLVLAAEALFHGAAVEDLRIAAEVDGEQVAIVAADGRLDARLGTLDDPDVRLSGSFETVLAALARLRTRGLTPT